MSQEVVIDLKPNGSVEALHFDHMSLVNIFRGTARIEQKRASKIELNPETQLFDVTLEGMDFAIEVSKGFDGYNRAIVYEIAWLQSARKHGVDPKSVQGLVLAVKARRYAMAIDKVPERV